MSLEYVNKHYRHNWKVNDTVKWSELGSDDRIGKVTGGDGAYVLVKFDDMKHSARCHPKSLTLIARPGV